jgi:hypothetical protein
LVALKPGLAVEGYSHLAGRTFLFFGLVGGSEQEAVLLDYSRMFFLEYVPVSMLEAI